MQAAQCIGQHHPIGSGTIKLLFRLFLRCPRNHLNLGVQLSGCKRNKYIIGITRKRNNHRGSPFDTCLEQHFVLGGIAINTKRSFFLEHHGLLLALLYHHIRAAYSAQLLTYFFAIAPIAAYHDVPDEPFYVALYHIVFEYFSEASLKDKIGNIGDGVSKNPQIEDNIDNNKNLPIVRQGLYLRKTHRGDGNHGHIQGIYPSKFFKIIKVACTCQNTAAYQQHRKKKLAEVLLCKGREDHI